MKKLFRISLILCLAMLMLVSCGKNKDKEEDDLGNLSHFVNPDGSTCTVTGIGDFTGDSLVIDSVDGYTVTAIEKRAFFSCDSIKNVVIADSVALIDELAFANCASLQSVKLPSNIKAIGNSVFYGCKSLVSVEIPSTLEDISDGMFAGCSALLEINIPEGVKRIGKLAFSECSSLKKVTIPKSVNEVDWYAFDSCEALLGVYISDIVAWCEIDFATDTTNPLYYAKKLYLNNKLVRELAFSSQINSNVKKIGDRAFINCKDIALVIVGNGDITSIGAYALAGTGISDIILPNTIEFIGVGAFNATNRLEQIRYNGTRAQWQSIYLGGDTSTTISCVDGDIIENTYVNTSKGLEYEINGSTCIITGIGTCEDTEIYVSNNIEGRVVTEIADSAFVDCRNIVKVILPETIISIGNEAFTGCASLESIYIPDGVEKIGDYAFAKCTSLKNISIPKGVKVVPEGLFSGCKALEGVEMHDGITAIASEAFMYCSSLGNVEIPQNVTVIGKSAFDSCTSLESVEIPDGVVSINSRAFYGCNNIGGVYIPASVTDIGDYAFKECKLLDTVRYGGTIEQWKYIIMGAEWNSNGIQWTIYCSDGEIFYDKNGKIKSDSISGVIGDNKLAFSYATNSDIASVVGIGENTSSHVVIPEAFGERTVTKINYAAFDGVESIESITIADTVSQVGFYILKDCTSLTSVNFGSGLKKIGVGMFYGCTGLVSITVPPNVTEMQEQAFRNCKNLQSVIFEGSSMKLGSDAFLGCTQLDTIVFMGTMDSWVNVNNPIIALPTNKITVYCTDGILNYNRCALTEAIAASAGLEYAKQDNGSYIVDKKGTCTDSEVIISNFVSYATGIGCVTEIDNSAFATDSDIKSVIIPYGITSIGNYAFSLCSALETVIMFPTVENINVSAFGDCTSLKSIVFKGTSDEWLNISKGDNWFSGTSGLIVVCTDITIEYDNVGNIIGPIDLIQSEGFELSEWGYDNNNPLYAITSIGSCADTDLTINKTSDGDIIAAISAGAFINCQQIESVVLSKHVQEIGSLAFSGCENLVTIEIGNKNIVIGDNAFEGCTNLKTIVFDGTKQMWHELDNGGSCFDGMDMFTVECRDGIIMVNREIMASDREAGYSQGFDITVNSDNITCAITGLGYCEDENLYIGGHIDGYKVTSISTSAFRSADKIKSVIISEDIESIGSHVFVACTSLESVELLCAMDSIPKHLFNACTNLKSINVPHGVTAIETCAFERCASLEEIFIPATVTFIGDGAFWQCTSLETVNYSGTMNEWYEIRSANAFREVSDFTVKCSDYTISVKDDFEYRSIETSQMLITGRGQYQNIINLHIPEKYNDKDVIGIGDGAFMDSSDVYSAYIPPSILNIGNSAFQNCIYLREVTFEGIPEYFGDNLFLGCDILLEIHFYGTTEEWYSIEKSDTWHPVRDFIVYCADGKILYNHEGKDVTNDESVSYGLDYINDGNTLTVLGIGNCKDNDLYIYGFAKYNGDIHDVSVIESGAFEGCEQIENIIISGNVSVIMSKAFNGCTNLKTVTLQSSAVSIGSLTFGNCESLEKIIFNGTKDEWGNVHGGRNWRTGTKGFTVVCTDGDIYYK